MRLGVLDLLFILRIIILYFLQKINKIMINGFLHLMQLSKGKLMNH